MIRRRPVAAGECYIRGYIAGGERVSMFIAKRYISRPPCPAALTTSRANSSGPLTNRSMVGHLVIAQANAEDGWWEAVVIAREGDMLTMRWRDFPGYPKFVQHRTAVALLKPGTP